MKSTTHFKNCIQNYLKQRAAKDDLFATAMTKPNKSIDDCVTYILNTVQKSGCSGFTDREIFGMAVHYYDEENISVGNPINCKVVVNHTVELTGEEKKQIHINALKRFEEEAYVKMKQTPKLNKQTSQEQPSLFDF